MAQSLLATYGLWIYYKVANNEGASWTWTWGKNVRTLGYAHAFYGNYNRSNPIQSSTTPYSGTASGTIITIPTLTTSADNTVSLLFASSYSTAAKTHAVPTSPAYTEHSDTGATTSDFWQAIASYTYPTSGTVTGTKDYPASAASTYRIGCQILINPNDPPTVALNSPNNAVTIVGYKPALNFTGTDTNGDSIEYNLEIDTTNTFDSFFGSPLRTRYSNLDIRSRSTNSFASGGTTSVVLPQPPGMSAEDLVFVMIRRNSAVDPISVPAGWTLIQKNLATYGFWLYCKVVTGENPTQTWTWASSSKTRADAYDFYGSFDVNSPIQSSTTPYSDTASATTINIPSLTTSAPNTYSLLFVSSYSTASKTHTVPTSPAYFEHSDVGDVTSDFYGAVAGFTYPTSGTATGVLSYPVSANSTFRVGCQVLIEPKTSTGFSGTNPYSSGVAVNFTPLTPLTAGTYYWRVRGIDLGGTNTYGSWSSIRSFTVVGGYKIWDGSQWTYKPIKVWDGSTWQSTKPLKVWNGSQWVIKG